MPVSKPFRIITEGDTTDGRVVDRSWIEQMAAGYDQKKYGARVWLEHIRGILPDSPFKAYGDVLKLGTEEVTIDGKQKLALTGVVDATNDLVAMHKARQKIYCSAEVDPNFAKSGKAYLAGLAVTDSPASLGTEMMSYAAGAGDKNPLAARKQNAENLFTVATEIELEFEDEKPNAGESLFTRVMGLLKGKDKNDAERFADAGKAIEAVADAQRGLLDQFASLQTELKGLATAAKTDREAFAALKAELDTDAKDVKRPAAAGGAGGLATDC